MIRVRVQGFDDIRRKLAAIPRDMHARVIGPALNKAADKAAAEIARAIPEEFAVKAAEVRNAVSIRRAAKGHLEAVVTVFGSKSRRGRSMNLVHFLVAYQAAGRAVKTRGAKAKARDLKALGGQLGFLIKRAGGLKKIDGAFVGNKGRTVFRRTGDARLPIEPLQVIGFSQMFASRKISARVMQRVRADLPIEIDRALARLLAS